MTKENTIGELLDRLEEQIKSPKDSVHKIVLMVTIENINKLLT
jgi:translation elongation factor EF-Tu-like GTPase